jgi:hypothetical protein
MEAVCFGYVLTTNKRLSGSCNSQHITATAKFAVSVISVCFFFSFARLSSLTIFLPFLLFLSFLILFLSFHLNISDIPHTSCLGLQAREKMFHFTTLDYEDGIIIPKFSALKKKSVKRQSRRKALGTTAWRMLTLRVEGKDSRHEGQLSRGPTKGGSPTIQACPSSKNQHVKNVTQALGFLERSK